MVRIRDKKGNIVKECDDSFIELCDSSGNIGVLLIVTDKKAILLSDKDEGFKRYLATIGENKSSNLITVNI